MNNKTLLGKQGEDLAVEYLKKQKYKIIKRNFRIRNGEIDIIAIDASEATPILVSIEVKTRMGNMYGTALEAITPRKLEALTRATYMFKSLNSKLPDLMRLDAVTVTFNSGKKTIELVKNIG